MPSRLLIYRLKFISSSLFLFFTLEEMNSLRNSESEKKRNNSAKTAHSYPSARDFPRPAGSFGAKKQCDQRLPPNAILARTLHKMADTEGSSENSQKSSQFSQSDLPELLNQYYKRLFPYKYFVQWLSYGGGNSFLWESNWNLVRLFSDSSSLDLPGFCY